MQFTEYTVPTSGFKLPSVADVIAPGNGQTKTTYSMARGRLVSGPPVAALFRKPGRLFTPGLGPDMPPRNK